MADAQKKSNWSEIHKFPDFNEKQQLLIRLYKRFKYENDQPSENELIEKGPMQSSEGDIYQG